MGPESSLVLSVLDNVIHFSELDKIVRVMAMMFRPCAKRNMRPGNG